MRAPVRLEPTTRAQLLRRAAARGRLWVPAHGASMGWTVPTGSSVLVQAAPRPRRGEVWAYCGSDGGVVVHRYRRRLPAGHRLQGDTCVAPDAPVGDALLIGRVVAVRGRGRARRLTRLNAIVGALQRLPRAVVARATRGARALTGRP